MEFKAKYGHESNCTPGVMTFEAGNRDQAIQHAKEFVVSGVRNGTWVNVDLNDAAYAARNVHGNAVGELTHY